MKITIFQPSGFSVVYKKCEVLFRDGHWLRFKGITEAGREVTITTSLPAEIHE